MFEWLKRVKKQERSLENPAVPLSEAYDYLTAGVPSHAGERVNELTSQQLPTIYAAVSLISDTMSTLPISLMERTDSGIIRNGDMAAAQLFDFRPNQMMTCADFVGALLYEALVYGNGYAAVIKEGEMPRELLLLPALSTRPVLRPDKTLAYRVELEQDVYELQADEVIHLRGMSRDGVMGFVASKKGSQLLGWSLATQKFSSKFFANGAALQGTLNAPGAIKDPEKMRAAWYAAYGGSGNSNRTAVLENGLKYERIGVPPEEAQFLQTIRLQREDLAALYRVPPHMVGIMDHATFSNIEHMNISFVQHTLRPWVNRLEQELKIKLLEHSDVRAGKYFFRVQVGDLLRGDQKTRYEAYQSGITAGWLTRNEARGYEDLNPIDGLDEPLTPLNMAGDVEEESEEEETEAERLLRAVRGSAARMLSRRIAKELRNGGKISGEFLDKHTALFAERLGHQISREALTTLLDNSQNEDDLAAAFMTFLGNADE